VENEWRYYFAYIYSESYILDTQSGEYRLCKDLIYNFLNNFFFYIFKYSMDAIFAPNVLKILQNSKQFYYCAFNINKLSSCVCLSQLNHETSYKLLLIADLSYIRRQLHDWTISCYSDYHF
jgi:hypothetical protein